MTKFAAVKVGMARKRERHFPTRYRVAGKVVAVWGATMLVTLSLFWSQKLYPSMVDARSSMDAVLNEHDEFVEDWTFKDFRRKEQVEPGTDLFLVRLLAVTNALGVAAEGLRPNLEERGAYAFTKRSFKYDVEWPDDSERVSYKEWHYYEEVEDVDECRLMWFRQGLSDYNENSPDYPEGCARSDEELTLFNPKFVIENRDYGAEGIIGTLSQEFFANILDALTSPTGFIRSVKTELVPEAIEAVWTYRRAVHASTALQEILDSGLLAGSSTPPELFAGTDDDATLANFIGTYLDPRGAATFGSASAVLAAGAEALSTSDADTLLNSSWKCSIQNFSSGIPLWIGAGRHLGMIQESQISANGVSANLVAFSTLVNETSRVLRRTHEDSERLVKAIASYLYEEWLLSPVVEMLTALEWGGHSSARRGGGCDAGDYDAASATKIRIVDHYFYYECAWGLSNESLTYYTYGNESIAEPLNATVARLVADFQERAVLNEVGIHTDDTLLRYWDTYEYCNASRFGAPTSCSGMTDATDVALNAVPTLLAKAEGVELDSQNLPRIRSQACAIAVHIFEEYALNDLWHETFVADWMNRRVDVTTFSASALEDFGYAQWSGGYVTTALWGVPSISNIRRQGYWKFYDAAYTEDLMEFHSHAMAIGYLGMKLTVSEGKFLLETLASRDPAAVEFRANIARIATTYHCDGTDCTDDGECAIEFDIRDNRAEREIDDDSLLGTCAPDGVYCDCEAGGNYFVPQNAFANFSKAATSPELERAAELLNAVFYSSGSDCVEIEELYQACVFLSNEPGYKVWVTNCEVWQTTISDGAFGIFCDETSILKIDTPYARDYTSSTSHPYPRRRGNVVASWLKEWTWSRLLTEGRVFCDDPSSCDHTRGGLFVTHSAKRFLFEGYVDRLSVKLLSHELAPYNLTIECVNRTTVDYTELCYPIDNNDCSDDLGFEIKSTNHVGVATFSRNGSRRLEWYLPELRLNLDNLSSTLFGNNTLTVKNPVFAVYPGKLMQNESAFHKRIDCINRLFGRGPRRAACDVVLDTGKRSLFNVRRLSTWFGNASLTAGLGFTASIPAPSGHLLDYQLEPLGWEGFKWFNFSYRLFRYEGLDFLGNSSIALIDPAHLLVHELDRQKGDDPDIGMTDATNDYYVEWPTRRDAGDKNYSRRAWIRGNRYETTQRTFDAARRRAFDRLSDTRGMPYTVPYGMVSLDFLANAPLFVSLPHFYGNSEWGGQDTADEYREVNFDTSIDRRLHTYFIDVEPVTGRVIREARRYQYNFRVERDALYPDIISSQRRCEVPTADFNRNGFGCFIFFPVWWVSEERIIDQRRAIELKRDYLDVPIHVFQTAMYGGGLTGITLFIAGIIPWIMTNRLEAAFRTRVYID